MIEQHHRPLSSSSLFDLEALQRRANHRRARHKHAPQPLQIRWSNISASVQTFGHSLTRLPPRHLLHAVVTLLLPLSVGLSQLQTGTPMPATQPTAIPSGETFIAPVAPLNLDAGVTVGDPPLPDSDEIPIPLSLVSRTEALAPVIVPGTIAGERIYLRNGPGTEYDAVGRMSGGTSVQVIGRHGDWFQIRERAGQPVYWAAGELLNLPENAVYALFEVQPEQVPPPPPPKVGMVRESGLQLRDGPGTNYVPMTKLDAGNQLELIETYQDWFHVGVPGGVDGWVKAEFMDVDPAIVKRLLAAETIPDPNPALVGVTSENQINLRKGPDSKYPQVGRVDAGLQLDLIGKYNDWFKVQLPDGTKAWIFSDLINTTERVIRRVPVTKDFPPLPARPRLQVRSGGGGGGAPSVNLAEIAASGDVASFAAQFAGARYRYGGASPSGFDCSGFTMYVYSKFGVSLPHNSAAQYSSRYGAFVGSMNNLAPGDLVFFQNTAGPGISHTAIYIGGGRIIHAMTPRYGVQVSNINDAYWRNHYHGAVRVQR